MKRTVKLFAVVLCVGVFGLGVVPLAAAQYVGPEAPPVPAEVLGTQISNPQVQQPLDCGIPGTAQGAIGLLAALLLGSWFFFFMALGRRKKEDEEEDEEEFSAS